MTHSNRGRLTVDVNGNWRLYTNTLPANATPLGNVTRSVTSGFMTVSEPSKLTLEYWEGVSICHVSQIENIVFFLLKKGDK